MNMAYNQQPQKGKESMMRMMMMRIHFAVPVLAMMLAGSVAAASDASKQMADTYAKAGAMAILRCTVQTEMGGQGVEGPAICIATQPKVIFITLSLDSRTAAEKVLNLTLTPVSSPGKSLKAELLGIDPETNIGFVAAVDPYDKWSVASFAPKSNLSVGQLVTSLGMRAGDAGYVPSVGIGYVSTIMEVPEMQVLVNGGTLTLPGSPVFNEDGKAVGLVAAQRPSYQQIIVNNRPTTVAMSGQEEASYFMPVDDFAHVIVNIPASPSAVRRLPWTGIVSMTPLSKEVAEIKKIDRPAVTIEQVVADQPAAKAGIKDGDVLMAINGENLSPASNPGLAIAGFRQKTNHMSVGQKVKFTVRRGDETKDFEVTLAPTPTLPEEAKTYVSQNFGFITREKVPFDQYRDKSSAATVPGLLVLLVANNSPAAVYGLLQGDLVTSVNNQAVSTVDAIKKVIEGSITVDPKKAINVVVRRGDQTQSLIIQTTAPAATTQPQ
jgi:serine protease Do